MNNTKYCSRKCRENGVTAYDCQIDEEVLLSPYPLLWAGDNPMQAEECSHGGLSCGLMCRTCKVGGTKKYMSTDEGYLELFEVYTSVYSIICVILILIFSQANFVHLQKRQLKCYPNLLLLLFTVVNPRSKIPGRRLVFLMQQLLQL